MLRFLNRESGPDRRWVIWLAAAVALLLLILFIWILTTRAETVETVRPVRQQVVELVIASGSLQAERQSRVGSEVPGVVESVYVREGERATAGDTLLTLERQEIAQQVEQSRLAVQTAREQLRRVEAGPTSAELSRARAELSQARRVNSARLEQARQNLRRLQTGRPEDVRRAQAVLREAQANLAQAQTTFNRTQELVRRGAVPRADLDQAETQLEVARAQVQSANEALALARRPASSEEIAAAQAEVRAAQATLEESVRIAEENLRNLLPRPEDIRIARSQLQQAQAALRQSEVALSKRIIASPISGLVVERDADPGESISPGQVLLTIADMTSSKVVVETDETNLPRLRVGQPSVLIPPAYPNRSFRGVISRIGPEVDEERGIVNIEIRPTVVPDYARPDMTVDANIEVARTSDALTVPISSVVNRDERTMVMVVRNDRVVGVPVRVLARGEQVAAVEGVQPDADVVVRGAAVTPGQRIRTEGINRD